MANDIENDNDDSDDSEPNITVAHIPGVRPGPGRPRNVTSDEPITNSEYLPLFPNASKREGRLAVSINVTRLDPPGAGFKGNIPATSDLSYVAGTWGDGHYTFDIINNKKEILKTREAVQISVGITPAEADANRAKKAGADTLPATGTSPDLLGILNTLILKLDRDGSKVESHTTDLLRQAREMAEKHSEMVIQSSKDSASRDHDWHKSQMLVQEKLFNTILAQVTANNDATMARLDLMHKQSMESQSLTFKQIFALTANTHKHEASMLREQLRFAEEHMSDGDDNEPPWMKAIEAGVSGIKELRLLATSTKDISKKRQIADKIRKLKAGSENTPKVTEKPNDNAEILRNRGTTMKRRIPQPVIDAASEPDSDGGVG